MRDLLIQHSTRPLDEAQYSAQFRDNPLVGLCTKLATYKVIDGRLVSFRGQPKRLLRQIGYALPRKIYLNLSNLSRTQWRFLEDCWIALMQSVMLMPGYDFSIPDPELVCSIQNFKIWFLKFSLRHAELLSDGTVIDKNFYHTAKAIKGLSAWIGWKCTNNPKQDRPKAIPYWKGNVPGQPPDLVWFGGRLKRFRRILHKRFLSIEEIASLAQLKTFNRALPPGDSLVVNLSISDCLNVLKTEKVIKPSVIEKFSQAAASLGYRLSNVRPERSHISLSTSGSFEFSVKEGGMAEHARQLLASLDTSSANLLDAMDWMEAMVPDGTKKLPRGLRAHGSSHRQFTTKFTGLRDVFGNFVVAPGFFTEVLFPHSYSCCVVRSDAEFGNTYHPTRGGPIRVRELGESEPVKLRDFLFAHKQGPQGKSHVGYLLLLLATGEALSYGRYEPQPDYYLEAEGPTGLIYMPLYFSNSGPVKFVPLHPLDCSLVGIPEPGFKCRVLTKCLFWNTIVQRYMRFLYAPVFERDGRARIGLSSQNKLWTFMKFIEGRSISGLIRSSDYSSATDNLDHVLIKAMWDGFNSHANKYHKGLPFIDLLYYPRVIHFGDSQIVTHSGSFQGEGMSFMTLTLYNLCVLEIVELDIRQRYEYHIPAAICGDDMISILPDGRSNHYLTRIIHDSGMVLSPGKDFTSRVYGTFTEDSIVIINGEIFFIDCVKGRLLTRNAVSNRTGGNPLIGKSAALMHTLQWHGSPEFRARTILLLQANIEREIPWLLSSTDCPWFLPSTMGGLGIPILECQKRPWMRPFINKASSLTSKEIVKLMTLELTKRCIRKGIIVPPELINLLKTDEHVPYKGIDDSCFKHKLPIGTIYLTKQIVPLLLKEEGDPILPRDNFGEVIPSEVEDLLTRHGFYRISWVMDQLSRAYTFEKFLDSHVDQESPSLNKWRAESKKLFDSIPLSDEFSGDERLKPFRSHEYVTRLPPHVLRHVVGGLSLRL